MLEQDEFREDLPGNKRQKWSRSKSVQLGYESDSEDNRQSDLDEDSEDEKEEDEKPKTEGSDDDMFASDQEENEGEKKTKPFDMDKFEKEQGLGKYDEEPDLNTNRAEEQAAAESGDAQKVIDYYNKIEEYDGERFDFSSHPKQDLALEAFDLREEAESGEFDKNMNYIRKATSDDENEEDAWMLNINNKDIENARKAQLRQENAVSNTHKTASTDKLLSDVIAILEPAETPMEALARLRPLKLRKKNKSKTRVTSQEEQIRKETVFSLTESCEQLLNHKGISQIYDATREELMRAFKRQTGEDFQNTSLKRSRDMIEETDDIELTTDKQIWEYRWLDDESEAWNGPHTTYEMKYWKDNYFENNVEVRRVGVLKIQHISTANLDDGSDNDDYTT